MTTTAASPSHIVHSGFNDLITLVASTPSRLGTNLASNSRLFVSPPQPRGGAPYTGGVRRRSKGLEDTSLENRVVARPHEPLSPRHKGDVSSRGGGRGVPAARGGRAQCLARGGRTGQTGGREEWQAVELKKRKVDKRMIGPPKDFRHIFHASTFEEATELLLRWSIEGVGDKLSDPAWAYLIKQLVKARAREQQARAVAAVVEATARTRELGGEEDKDLPPPGTLRVINGLPSSIYSTVNAALPLSAGPKGTDRSSGNTSISPLLARGSTPNLIANISTNYFEHTSSGENSVQSPVPSMANPFVSPPATPMPPSASPGQKGKTKPLQIRKKPVPPMAREEVANPDVEEHSDKASGLPEPQPQPQPLLPKVPPTPPTPPRKNARPSAQDVFTPLPFRIVKPSLPTLEKAMSIALFFEQYYHALLKPSSAASNSSTETTAPVHPGNYVLSRARRLAQLESTFALPENRFMSEAEKEARREELIKEENRILRERRKKVDVKGFELGRVIGHGAFGVVRIARERQSGRLVAMKQLRKADMLRKSQEGHVKAEKDLLAAAASSSAGPSGAPSRIVQLFYAFQDPDHLYLVLEYMGGGDLLNLLVERDTFPEEMTRFYVAEMILALEETHSLGYVHRDIKPDNFLFDKTGHIKVSDFGLATDLHWAHDTNYYEQQRLALLKKHGVDLEYPSVKTKRMKREDVEKIMGKEWMEEGKGVFTWREKNRKKLAYSVCGTNSYMAPEVIRGQGYGFSCDWWSLGIIMYESLYGYPPFVSSSRHITRQKILNWKQTLKFPPRPRLSSACTDLITKFLCEPEDRLGCTPLERASVLTVSKGSTIKGAPGLGSDGAEMIKAHEWFKGIEWDNLHKMTPPYHPNLYSEDDTRHFDDDIPDEPLAPANGAGADATKDPLLRNKTHGAHLLEIRKGLAFKGWTFKSPNLDLDNRYGHMGFVSSGGEVSHMKDVSDKTIKDVNRDSSGDKDNVVVGSGKGTVRTRALSL
ncbi:hypothetical protein CI109_104998 [Kwoniella shandongensis]|uniref:non-specific serine/threonine protein kinase n=1 Tax=Kwoniella shandongensis TaxID=1734106 RepID=A0A5M6BSM8_9TREE|nr:uncharacterized protein CI109_006714 [Kwoniella shandongensis]KAA5524990.1 hypothetical protein CI109_006714 [Kwoniella shandongensis]